MNGDYSMCVSCACSYSVCALCAFAPYVLYIHQFASPFHGLHHSLLHPL